MRLIRSNFRVGGADFVRDMGSGFADQLQVTQGSVIGQPIRHETSLVESVGVDKHLAGKVDHVVKVETPFEPNRAN